MAFNFNWSPLIADTSRAREMLTAALNKSPKPPIIVDDIIVTELNLGSTPPELEILEIGDLADDRFRGIFKMSYTGDAFLTLKTRVQANPLNTYLSTKPSFSSPQPLAAASGLTIPLQITLSDIRLSGFVILVFSRQKGLTIVFRNDPLESLKVSSTFDSIPFIRDYLQKEIERQLRILFMEDLPAILHRLSLRLWSPDHQELVEEENKEKSNEAAPIDPLASPRQDPVDAFGNPIDENDLAFSLDSLSELHASSFSTKNLLRLAALTESQRTLSLFTPTLSDTVYRARAGAAERTENSGFNTPLTHASLSRINSSASTSLKSPPSSVADGSESGTNSSSRPSLQSYGSGYSGLGLSLGASRPRTTQTRKRKKRVINLRKDPQDSETMSVTTDTSTPPPTISVSAACSVIHEEQIDDVDTPRSPLKSVHFGYPQENLTAESATVPHLGERINSESLARSASPVPSPVEMSRNPWGYEEQTQQQQQPPLQQQPSHARKPSVPTTPISSPYPTRHRASTSVSSTSSTSLPLLRNYSLDKFDNKFAFSSPHHPPSTPLSGSLSPPQMPPQPYYPLYSPQQQVQHGYAQPHPILPFSPTGFEALAMGASGGILEQAWMTKMAREIARRVREETRRVEEKAQEARRDRMEVPTGPGASSERDIKMTAGGKISDPAAGFWERAAELMGEAPPAYAA